MMLDPTLGSFIEGFALYQVVWALIEQMVHLKGKGKLNYGRIILEMTRARLPCPKAEAKR